MARKSFLILVLMPVIVGGAFAQADFGTMPKNTITVDFGPTIVAAAFRASAMAEGIPDGDSLSYSGFGIATQYERQLLQQLSVAGRFAYMGVGMGITLKEDGFKGAVETKLSSFSLEGHLRYYPFSGVFFLEGMLGYANIIVNTSGEFIITDDNGDKRTESESINVSRNYLKYGGKLGWRISFGRQGGFTMELSLGYNRGIGFGDGLENKLLKSLGEDASELDASLAPLEEFIFVGGPRISIAFGWRF